MQRSARETAAGRNVKQSLVAATLVAWLAACAASAASAADPNKADTRRATRNQSARELPFDRIDPAVRQQVADVVSNASIFRRMPISVVPCEPNLYQFMVRNPDVIVNLWEAMGIANVAMQRTGPGQYVASDNGGTLCNVRFVHASHDTHIIYAEGTYNGPLFLKPVRANCVLMLKSAPVREVDGTYYVTSRMDAFIQIENAGAELLAKTMHPLVGRSADYNFTETTAFLSALSRTIQRNQPAVERVAGKLNKIDPEVRDQFVEIISITAAAQQQPVHAVTTRHEE